MPSRYFHHSLVCMSLNKSRTMNVDETITSKKPSAAGVYSTLDRCRPNSIHSIIVLTTAALVSKYRGGGETKSNQSTWFS